MGVDHSEAHIRLNRLLDGTFCGATTEERRLEGVLLCAVSVTRWPKLTQILKSPKVVYKASHSTWEDAYEAFAAWVEAELPGV